MKVGNRVKFVTAPDDRQDYTHYKGNGEQLNVGAVGMIIEPSYEEDRPTDVPNEWWKVSFSDEEDDWAIIHESRLAPLGGPTRLVNL